MLDRGIVSGKEMVFYRKAGWENKMRKDVQEKFVNIV